MDRVGGRYISRVFGVALALLAVWPASASAARVETVEDNDFVRFRAAPGEQNEVTLSLGGSRNQIRVEARGGPLEAATGCRLTSDPQVALCRSDFAYVHLGDGDDRLTFLTPGLAFAGSGDDVLIGGPRPSYLFGGDGADRLSGGRGADALYGDRNSLRGLFDSYGPAAGDDDLEGGPGHDWLGGGPGDDRLSGGGGNDGLAGAGPPVLRSSGERVEGGDTLAGGPGLDVAEYNFQPPSGRNASLTPELEVTLDGQANDGPAGGRDNVAADVERAYSLSAAFLVAEGGRFALLPLGEFRGFGYRPRTDRDPRIGARIYRLTSQGTLGAQTGVFSGGTFSISERQVRRRPTSIRLPSSGFERCRQATGAHASQLSRRIIHRLRASARGNFRSRGRHSSATIRGTGWSITERCDGTLTKVTRGRVVVRDFRRNRTVVLTAGESYLARAPG